MHKLITILVNSNGHFTAEQNGQSFALVSLLLAAGAVVLALIFARSRAWIWELIPLVLLLIAVGLLFANRGKAYRMEITPGDAMHVQQFDGGKPVLDSNIYLESFASADLEYRRQDRRIVAVLRDGRTIYPLGEDYVASEPDQFVVLTAIREAIGRTPPEQVSPVR